MGHDFPKDKDVWGGICQTLSQKGENPCVIFFVLFQLPPFNNFCWQLGKVMAVNCFGSGVAGLSVHASMHTPPSSWLWNGKGKPSRTLHSHRFFSLSLHELLNTHALKFRVLAIVAHLHAGNLLLLLTHIKFCILSIVFVHPQAQEELFIPHGVWLFLACTGISGFYPRDFLLRIGGRCSCIFASRAELWILALIVTHS